MNNVTIFILCYNESILLPHTIKHYRTYLPNSKIIIYDNESNDNSVEIAKNLGLHVIDFTTNNKLNEMKQTKIKNNCWKNVDDGWIIVIDMDEWLCVTEQDLKNEMDNGTNILRVKGLQMIGESLNDDVSDIDLHTIDKCIDCKEENKNICFYRRDIEDINYTLGAHKCTPVVKNIKYSDKVYINKHMAYLGIKFIINKTISRYNRSEDMRNLKLACHYTDNIKIIELRYNNLLKNSYNYKNQLFENI